MDPIQLIAADIFDKIRSRFDGLKMGDESGMVVNAPEDARFFDFNFTIAGNKLGRVSISVNDPGSLKIFYGQGILDDVGKTVSSEWYDFLRDMRQFAKRRMMSFDARNITKRNLDKNDFQYLANKGVQEAHMKENAMFGSSKSSYYQPSKASKTKIIVRHSAPVQAESKGARRRNIKSIYVENGAGERFKLPTNNLLVAEAMARHVINGGNPYDKHGQAIVNMGETIHSLGLFRRQVGSLDTGLSEDATKIFSQVCSKYDSLREGLRQIVKQAGYKQWVESFVDDVSCSEIDGPTIEDYKNKFSVNSFNEGLSDFFPLIHRIMQEASTIDLGDYTSVDDQGVPELTSVDQFSQFESWANSVTEGVLTDDNINDLRELLSAGITLGVDGISAVEALQGIGIDDTSLNDALRALAKINPEMDPTETIMAWVEKSSPEAAKELEGDGNTSNAKEPEQTEEAESATRHPKKGSTKEIAEFIKSFFDKETGKFPLGETAIVTKVRKEFGDKAADVAEKFIAGLLQQTQTNSVESDVELADLARLSGTAMDRVLRRAKGG